MDLSVSTARPILIALVAALLAGCAATAGGDSLADGGGSTTDEVGSTNGEGTSSGQAVDEETASDDPVTACDTDDVHGDVDDPIAVTFEYAFHPTSLEDLALFDGAVVGVVTDTALADPGTLDERLEHRYRAVEVTVEETLAGQGVPEILFHQAAVEVATCRPVTVDQQLEVAAGDRVLVLYRDAGVADTRVVGVQPTFVFTLDDQDVIRPTGRDDEFVRAVEAAGTAAVRAGVATS